ncbi:helix-turn-helix domain-containing protein [Muricauda sp. SCSIO 64092]|uniref:helix-turn-helix domain-containing protein n=1 Tax=Allomuricauda sp. SCSIO 64092 TaxID=2908842 RepID=UPI001FF26838|nr:helix-turn-helix domain-containing protein [Muricauda sp. SCSIO 64092]UOY08527.1 helix-turn-helix domain-containing protein [Muricauda sp. SCSIO 64092]
MKRAGEIVKQKRIDVGLTLRTFCNQIDFDSSNWSKIERGLLEFPKSGLILSAIAETLKMSDEEIREVKDVALVEAIPDGLKPEEDVLKALPVFFRTSRVENPSDEQLKELINLIRKH